MVLLVMSKTGHIFVSHALVMVIERLLRISGMREGGTMFRSIDGSETVERAIEGLFVCFAEIVAYTGDPRRCKIMPLALSIHYLRDVVDLY
jgi:hypothetical protein